MQLPDLFAPVRSCLWLPSCQWVTTVMVGDRWWLGCSVVCWVAQCSGCPCFTTTSGCLQTRATLEQPGSYRLGQQSDSVAQAGQLNTVLITWGRHAPQRLRCCQP